MKIPKTPRLFLVALAALVLIAAAACGQRQPDAGDQNAPPADSATPATPAPENPPAAAPATPAPAGHTAPSGHTSNSGSTSAANSATPPAAATPSAPAETPMALVTIPEGKNITVTLDTGLSSATSTVGQAISATVKKDVQTREHPQAIVPMGSVVTGQVVEVQKATQMKGQAKMVVRFDQIRLPSGKTLNLVASLGAQGADTTKRSVGGIAGGAAAGAILGRIIGKDTKGAVIGAVAGGAIGTGVVLGMNNKDIELPAGTDIVLNVDQALEVPVAKKDV